MRRLIPWLAGGAALCLYGATVSRGLAWDDSGELAAGIDRLGVVHQTGYPVYLLLGKAFTAVVPFGSAAVRANLWSAALAALAAGLVARYVLVATGSALGAVAAAAMLVLGPVVWYQATVASVYPALLAAIALLLNAADAWERRPTPGRLALLAGSIGLVAMSHKSGVAFAVGGIAFVLAVGRRSLLDVRHAAALAALLLPLAAVAYLPLRAGFDGFPNLRADAHASVLDWVAGSVGAGDAEPLGAGVHLLSAHVERLLLALAVSLSPAVAILGPLGSWVLRRRRAFLWCCLAPALVVSVAVVTTPGAYLYWHLPLVLAGAVASGAGVARLVELVRGRTAGRVALAGGLALALAFVGAVGGSYVGRSHRDASGWARATLAALPRGGRVRAPWAAYTVLAATKELEHRRPDVGIGIEPFGGPRDYNMLVGSTVVDMYAGPEPPDAGPGLVLRPVGPSSGANVKGLSGLRLGSLRIGFARSRAQAYEVVSGTAPRTRRARP